MSAVDCRGADRLSAALEVKVLAGVREGWGVLVRYRLTH
jgi:hypothetical protein